MAATAVVAAAAAPPAGKAVVDTAARGPEGAPVDVASAEHGAVCLAAVLARVS